MFDIKALFKEQHKQFYQQHPYLSKIVIAAGKRLWLEEKAKAFRASYPDAEGAELLACVFDYLDLAYEVDENLQNMPKTGRLIIVANHPLGYLDGMGLLEYATRQRSDVKMLVNQGLHNLLGMPELTIGVDSFHGRLSKQAYKAIKQQLEGEGALIIFPSGLVSRRIKGKLRDMPWNPSFVRFARNYSAPVLPVFIRARNSSLFYILSRLTDPLARRNLFIRELMMMKLLREFLSYQKGKVIKAYLAPLADLQSSCFAGCEDEQIADHLREIVYQLDNSQV